MIVAFPFAFNGAESKYNHEIGLSFVRTARKYLKTVEIVQMSDMKTGEVPGIDSCFRVDSWPFGIWYFDAMLAFPAEQFLRIDYDAMIRRDVSDVFSHDFDIAIAKEHNGRMNNGVVFVKNKEVLKDAQANYMKTGMDNWQDIQTAMQETIDSGLFRIRKLDESYNMIFKPDRQVTIPEDTHIVHFKGVRKELIVNNFK